MNLLDTSADRVHASVIQRAQMEAESLAAFARKNGLALKVDVEPQRDQVIVVRDAALPTPAPTMVDEREAFEATVGNGRVLARAPNDEYVSTHVQNDWDVWQTACKEVQRAACNFCLAQAAEARENPEPGSIREALSLEGFTLCKTEQGYRLLRLGEARAELSGSAPDPMDWPLPCDVTVGHGTMRKGVTLRTLVNRMKTLYEMATGNDADVVANRTPEERKELADRFLAAIHDKRPLHEQIAEIRRQERPSASVLNTMVGASHEESATLSTLQSLGGDAGVSEEKHAIEGTVTFMRSDPEGQVCVCCPKGGGHIFSRGIKWDAYETHRPEHFGSSANVFVDSRITDYNANEGRRVRLTVELLPAAPKAAEKSGRSE